MKNSFLLILPSLLSLVFSAADVTGRSAHNYPVKGAVLDSDTSEPLEFVTVALRDTSGNILSGATSDSAGIYVLSVPETAEGLEVYFSLVGYKDVSFRLDGKNIEEPVDLGTTRMKPDAEMLSGASVSGKRPLIEHQFDRLVLNVSELAVAQTGDALDVLKSSPGVTVDSDGNVKLNGSTVAVWIDGRPSNMSGRDLEAYLKGSDGTSIEKVELISNPSAKYDAEGSGGIINIKTKKAFMKGLSGTLSARAGLMYSPGTVFDGDIAANLMYRTDKTNTFFHYTPSFGGNRLSVEEMKLYGEGNSMRQESAAAMESSNSFHIVRLGNDWNVSDKDIVGVIFKTVVSPDSRDRYVRPNIVRDYMNAGTAGESMYSQFAGANESLSQGTVYSLNLNYTRTFDASRSQELTMNADYYRKGDREESTLMNEYSFISDKAQADGVRNNGFTDRMRRSMSLYSFKADYSQTLWKQTGRLESGVKAAYSSTKNDYGKTDYNPVSDAFDIPAERNDFTYDEQVYAGYFNIAKKFSDKWNAQAGVRGEYTVQAGNWLMSSENSRQSRKDYFDIFPNAFLSYVPSDKAMITASYSYRISRPKYWQLNPFRDYVSSTSYTQGNIELEPSYGHNISLNSVLFNRFTLSAGYTNVRNYSDVQTPIMDDKGMVGMIFSNAGVQQVAYAAASVSELPLTKWWNLTVNASYYYTYFQAYKSLASDKFGGSFSNTGHSFTLWASTTFFLPENFKLGIDGWMATPQAVGYFNTSMMGLLNASMSKTFWDGKGTLSLYVYDILNMADTNLAIEQNGVRSYVINQDYSSSGVHLGFTWRFGSNSQKSRRNVGDLDEESRF